MRAFEEFIVATKDTPGWFHRNAAGMWDCLLDYQESRGVTGDFLEIGVWKGKSAALAAMHSGSEEQCVFVDYTDMTEAQANVEGLSAKGKVTFIQESSGSFSRSPLAKRMRGQVRWVHIDGGHSAADVLHDLTLANRLLSPRGIVVVDDFFSPGYPQITQATFRYLQRHSRQFVLILLGWNKGFLCRPSAAQEYLRYIKDSLHAEMAARGCGDVTLWKTNTPNECNAFGIMRDSGSPYRGLDADHSKIVI